MTMTKFTTIRNLTGRTLALFALAAPGTDPAKLQDGERPVMDLPAEPGAPLRARMSFGALGQEVCGVPLTTRLGGEVSGLPEPQEGVLFLVTAPVAAALAGTRDDVASMGDAVFGVGPDGKQMQVGARGLVLG